MRRLLILSVFISLALHLAAQSVAGSWEGILSVGAGKLPLIFHITGTTDAYSATMDSPAQGAKGYPVAETRFSDSRLTLSLPALKAVYEATLHADTLIGIFSQAGMQLPLTLVRVADGSTGTSFKRPQEPVAPYPYMSEEVTFENPAAEITLSGTFTYPKQGGPFPAVILVTGSGPQNRNEELLGHKPFFVLSDYLTRQGIAVLRYDDRGVGQSKGDYPSATIEDLSGDAAAAYDWLRKRPEVIPGKTGIVGHSEGGTIAILLAGSSRVDPGFIVSLAGMAVPGDTLLRAQRYLISKGAGLSNEAIEKTETILASVSRMMAEHPDDEIRKNLPALSAQYLPASLREDNLAKQIFAKSTTQMLSPGIRSLTALDPSDALRRISCPVLALNGEKDVQVPADMNLVRIRELVTSPLTARSYPDLNHLFQHSVTGMIDEYPQIEETLSPEVLTDIAAWILAR